MFTVISCDLRLATAPPRCQNFWLFAPALCNAWEKSQRVVGQIVASAVHIPENVAGWGMAWCNVKIATANVATIYLVNGRSSSFLELTAGGDDTK